MTVRTFRKKPVEIEAMQFENELSIDPILRWIRNNGSHAHRNVRRFDQHLVIVIETLEGEMAADYGDWVIRGIKGEFYPCKPDIFDATYEPVTP